MAPTATGSKTRWAPQARRVWAGAGPQRAARTWAGAYRGGLPPTACWSKGWWKVTQRRHAISKVRHRKVWVGTGVSAIVISNKFVDNFLSYPNDRKTKAKIVSSLAQIIIIIIIIQLHRFHWTVDTDMVGYKTVMKETNRLSASNHQTVSSFTTTSSLKATRSRTMSNNPGLTV